MHVVHINAFMSAHYCSRLAFCFLFFSWSRCPLLFCKRLPSMAAKLEPKPSDPAAVLLQAHTRLSSTFFVFSSLEHHSLCHYHQAVRVQMEEHGGPMQALNFMLPDPESAKELSIINHFHYPPHAFPPTPSNHNCHSRVAHPASIGHGVSPS